MKDILVLLVLLSGFTTKVCSQPYHADADGNCLNSETEYLLEGTDLCCQKCPPGQKMKHECSETNKTVCEECPRRQYMENWNYAPNCATCARCKIAKGLQEAQSCSSSSRSRCVCQPGKYCNMGFDGKYCTSYCSNYKTCRAGWGLHSPGTGNANVMCERCLNGTFSDTVSSVDHCQPHTNCYGRVVVKKGDAISDTMCEPPNANTQSQTSTKNPPTEMLFTTATEVMSTLLLLVTSETTRGPPDSTLSLSPSAPGDVFDYSTKPPTTSSAPDSTLDSMVPAVLAGVIGLLVFIAIILLFLCKPRWKKVFNPDAARFPPGVDANGNCESGDKIDKGYLRENQRLITLISDMEPVRPQASVPPQSSSQPTSPQVISPLTTNPIVNITVNIGNGSCGTPNGTHIESQLQFRDEEELLSIPQQEAGKESLMSVQENESYTHEESPA